MEMESGSETSHHSSEASNEETKKSNSPHKISEEETSGIHKTNEESSF